MSVKFTIVIPTYNGAEYVEAALQSAINQTLKADAIIVSDDNSIDNTLEICSRYKEHIQIYQNENGPSGFVEGWNNAISLVEDGYIAILHQDDLLAPTFLEEAEKALSKHPEVKHFFVPCNYIDGDGTIKREPNYCDGNIHRYSGIEYADAYRAIGKPHIHRCPGVITHRSIFDVCKYRKEAGHIADDDFFYRVGQYTDVVGVLKPLASYRIHEKSETGHLENIKLVTRLANDYIYQVEQSPANSCVSKATRAYFDYWASYYTFQEFVHAIIHNDNDLYELSMLHKNRLKTLHVNIRFKERIIYGMNRLFGRKFTRMLLKALI